VKPAPFVYHDPPNLDLAMQLLSELGEDARLLAGGQSLMPLLNFRVARPDHLIDVRHLTELTGVKATGSHLEIGALTTHRVVETSGVIRAAVPLLSEAAAQIGHIPIRERGTIGGSISFADPTAEMPLASVVLDAELTLQSVRGNRSLRASGFFLSAMQTELAHDEILTKISIPRLRENTGWAFMEFARRKGDFAIVGVAVLVGVNEGKFESARLGLCGVSDRPILIGTVEQIIGKQPGESTINSIAEAIAVELEPGDDARATSQDRREIAKTLIGRALALASRRASFPRGGIQ